MTRQERAGEIAYYEGQNGESFDDRVSSEQIDEAPALPDVPAEMLISTIAQCPSPNDICERTYPAYEAIKGGEPRMARWRVLPGGIRPRDLPQRP